MSRALDPRFHTEYGTDFRGVPPWRQNRVIIPSWLNDNETNCCDGGLPGYNLKRPDKGYALQVNDYPYHNIQYHGGLWDQVVHTDNQDLVGRKADPTYRGQIQGYP